MSYEVKSCVFMINKSIIKMFLTSRVLYPLYCVLQWKICLVWIRREICTDQAQFTSKTVQNGSTLIFWWILMWETTADWPFHWRTCYYGLWTHILARSNGLKYLNDKLFLRNTQLFTSQDVNWWTEVVWVTWGLLWCFYQLFGLSFWRHPFTAEDPSVKQVM